MMMFQISCLAPFQKMLFCFLFLKLFNVPSEGYYKVNSLNTTVILSFFSFCAAKVFPVQPTRCAAILFVMKSDFGIKYSNKRGYDVSKASRGFIKM